MTCSSVQEWSKLKKKKKISKKKTKHNSVSSVLKEGNAIPGKVFNEIQKEGCMFFFFYSPFSFFRLTFLFSSERAASVLASKERDTWKRLGFRYRFKKETCSAGFIGLLKVAITRWIQASGEHEDISPQPHTRVFGIREKNINGIFFFWFLPFLECSCVVCGWYLHT